MRWPAVRKAPGSRYAYCTCNLWLKFSPCVDKVDHGILLNKLKQIRINCKIGVWIHNFLSNRQQCVAVNGTAPNEAQVRSDVPQGSVLGPLLFLIHISDINFEIADSTVSCFANDIYSNPSRNKRWRRHADDTKLLT